MNIHIMNMLNRFREQHAFSPAIISVIIEFNGVPLITACNQALSIKNQDAWSTPSASNIEPTIIQSTFNFFKSGFKLAKEFAREHLHVSPIINNYSASKITSLEALYQLLTLSIGDKGPHSFKYKLLFNLFGRKQSDDAQASFLNIDDVNKSSEIIDLFTQELDKQIRERWQYKL